MFTPLTLSCQLYSARNIRRKSRPGRTTDGRKVLWYSLLAVYLACQFCLTMYSPVTHFAFTCHSLCIHLSLTMYSPVTHYVLTCYSLYTLGMQFEPVFTVLSREAVVKQPVSISCQLSPVVFEYGTKFRLSFLNCPFVDCVTPFFPPIVCLSIYLSIYLSENNVYLCMNECILSFTLHYMH